jgi:hypothetical protein
MSKFFLPLTDVKNVPAANASGTVTVDIPTDGRVLNIKTNVARGGALATLAQMRAAIRTMRLKVGAEVLRQLSFAEFEFILNANGYTVEAGLLSYFFAEPWRATVLDEEILAFDAWRYKADGVKFEMDITNDATALAFSPRYEFDERAKVDPATKQAFMRLINYTVQMEPVSGGTKLIKLNTLDGSLQRIHILTPAAVTLSRVRLLIGRTPIYDITQTVTDPGLHHQLKDMGMVIPAAHDLQDGLGSHNSWPVIPDNNQQLRNAFENGQDIQIETALSAACDVRLILETNILR